MTILFNWQLEFFCKTTDCTVLGLLERKHSSRNEKHSCLRRLRKDVNWLTGLPLLWLVVETEGADSSVTQENKIRLRSWLVRLSVVLLTWRCNKRLSRGQRKRVKKIWFCVEKEHFKASLGYVLCRLSDLANAGFRISGMATPRISWDVFVPSLLQTGTKLTRWEEVNRSISVFNSYTNLCGEKSQRISLCGEASQVRFSLGRLYVL